MEILLIAFVSYICGSVPFGLILVKIFTKNDIRNIGSGNIGATNVLRTGNKYLAVCTLLLDCLKGYFPVAVVNYFFPDQLQISALMVFLGHVFPIWLKFKGGKGVATYVGILFCINLHVGIIFIISWLIIFLLFKYSSLASILSTLIIPFYTLFFNNFDHKYFYMIMFILIFYTHRENVKRLINKEESKTKIY